MKNRVATIRPGEAQDLRRLQEIEILAGVAFTGIGMDEIAEADPPSLVELQTYVDEQRCWVAAPSVTETAADVVAAFVVVDLVDGQAHIEQISVDPAYARQRLGRALIEHVADWARGRECEALTLTTFESVPWNAPYYERCGFRRMAGSEIGPELARLRQAEKDHGLDRWTRVCMRRELSVG